MRTPKNAPHGTYNGYVNYRCRCEPCKAAAAEYHKGWRQQNPAKARREADTSHARARALTRLAKLHPKDFRALYADELLTVDPPQRELTDAR